MCRNRFPQLIAGLFGVSAGLLLWALVLGAHIHRQEPGLWALRFQRVLACGLDYNGPPYRDQMTLWLTCGEQAGWRVWPPDGR